MLQVGHRGRRRSSLVDMLSLGWDLPCRILFLGGAPSSEDALPCAWFPPSSPSVESQSLSHRILESFSQIAYCCWKGLWGSRWHIAGSVCWDWGRGLWASSDLCVGHASGTLSGRPALPFTFCLPPVATSWQLTCTHDQLWGTRPPGLMDALQGWGWLLTACHSRLEAGLLSRSWGTSLGRSALRLLLAPLQLHPLGCDRLVWAVDRPMSNDCQSWN